MGYKLTSDAIALILDLFYGGISLRRISLIFRRRFDLPISPPTILRLVSYWVKATDEALSHVIEKRELGFNLRTGSIWEIDETYVKIENKNFPLIVVRDLSTAFIIIAILASAVTTQAVKKALALAKTLASKCPAELRSDGHPAYPRAVRAVFRGKTRLVVNERVDGKGMNQSIEATFSQLKGRIKAMRGLHSREISVIILKGLIIDYNFAKPSEVSGGRTPAEVAFGKTPIDNKGGWYMLLDLAKWHRRRIANSKKPKCEDERKNSNTQDRTQTDLDPFLSGH